MKKYWAFAACMILVSGAASSAAPSEKMSFGPGKPVPAGNVVAGGHVYNAVCWACHGANFGSGSAPTLAGPAFIKIWQGRSPDALSDLIRNTMPRDQPGMLSDQMARDVTAYLVAHANQSPANPSNAK